LADVFPEARFISIVRDGRASRLFAVACQLVGGIRSVVVRRDPAAVADKGGDPWEACARTWVEEVRVIEAGLAGLDPARVLRVTYEAMVREPAHRARRHGPVWGSCAVPCLDRVSPSPSVPNRNEGWRRNLDAELVAEIEGIQVAELRRYGYL